MLPNNRLLSDAFRAPLRVAHRAAKPGRFGTQCRSAAKLGEWSLNGTHLTC